MGLTDALKRCFYPTFSYADSLRLRKNMTTSARGRHPRQFALPTGPNARGCSGRSLGRIVDSEINRWAKYCIDAAGSPRPDSRRFHPWTIQLIHLWESRGWQYERCQTQLKLKTDHADVKTSLDLVFWDPATHTRILVELKCCASTGYKKASTNLGAPYADIPSSPYSHHQLQLGYTTKMFNDAFPESPIHKSVIVTIGIDGIRTHKLQPWVLARWDSSFARMKQQVPVPRSRACVSWRRPTRRRGAFVRTHRLNPKQTVTLRMGRRV